MLSQINELASKAFAELAEVTNFEELESWRIRYLGKKSFIVQNLRSLTSFSLDERKIIGGRANEVKKAFEAAIEEKRTALDRERLANRYQSLDITLPGKKIALGHLHPTTQTLIEISDIFKGMGFQIVEGPEVEWDYYNFQALNMPEGHPARDMFATLWIDAKPHNRFGAMLLRTHTSPVQIRAMERLHPPIRIIAPGKVYRYEATDVTHEWMFHQVEGLAVDRNISMADLKGTLFEFARQLFGKDRKFRFRCDYFPFVEPGGELAIDCINCHGSGCRVCGNSGWLEILGCGMVHPEVLRRVGIDPDVFSGFAFGMGVERIPILRYGVEDIRLFYSNDLRFLEQF